MPPGLSSRTPSRIWPPSPGSGWKVGSCTRRRSGSTADRAAPGLSWLGAGLQCVSFRDTSPKMREVARDARYALHTTLPSEDHAGEHGEFMVRGSLEQIPPSHPAVTARPGQTP